MKTQDTLNKTHPPSGLSWTMWSLAAAFYLSGFYQRVAPAVITDHLMADFNMGAAALGNLSALYFYSYVAMQIPTGILADSWGPRKLLAAGALISSLGGFLFALAPGLFLAGLGRLMIGGAVGVAWVAMLKVSVHWFPPQRFATTTGLGLCAGVVGAISAGVPLRILVDSFGWRPVMLVSAAIVLILTVVIWMVLRDDPSQKGYKSHAPASASTSKSNVGVLQGLVHVFKYRNTWLLTIAPSGIVGPVLAFAGLWGVPFFTTHYALAPAKSAALTSTLLVAWALGGPLCGALSDRSGYRKPVYLTGNIIACVGWGVVLFIPQLPVWLLVVLMAVIGLSSGAIVIGFAYGKESVPPSLAGTVTGVINMGVMLGPMILQPLMGWILDQNWQGALADGIRIYDLNAYRTAFLAMMGWSILAAVMLSFTRETGCCQSVED
jgi:MFS family permease